MLGTSSDQIWQLSQLANSKTCEKLTCVKCKATACWTNANPFICLHIGFGPVLSVGLMLGLYVPMQGLCLTMFGDVADLGTV